MNNEQLILQNQTEMMKEMSEVKQNIGKINGMLSRLIPQINGMGKNQENFVTKPMLILIISISAGIWIPAGVLLTKLLGYW